jgi:hypothetical protein
MTALVGVTGAGSQALAMEAWNTIQIEDVVLVQALKAVRNQVTQLSLDARDAWNNIAQTLESQLEQIHTCAQSLRIKMEELMVNSDGLPVAGGLALPHDYDYRKAALQLGLEKHEFPDFTAVFKGLLMWSETPDERMRKNRSLTVSF